MFPIHSPLLLARGNPFLPGFCNACILRVPGFMVISHKSMPFDNDQLPIMLELMRERHLPLYFPPTPGLHRRGHEKHMLKDTGSEWHELSLLRNVLSSSL